MAMNSKTKYKVDEYYLYQSKSTLIIRKVNKLVFNTMQIAVPNWAGPRYWIHVDGYSIHQSPMIKPNRKTWSISVSTSCREGSSTLLSLPPRSKRHEFP